MRGRIRLGMVGGGQGAFIGAVHRLAARMDDQYEFVAGALSSDAARSKLRARNWASRRTASMPISARWRRPKASGPTASRRSSIVTPEPHPRPGGQGLHRGRHPCDLRQAASLNLKEAQALEKLLAKNKNVIFALTHNYSGYPMIRQARAMVAAGELGDIRLVQGEYPQDWLTNDIEKSGQKQAAWRTDPTQTGAGGCIGDIGTHAYQLAVLSRASSSTNLPPISRPSSRAARSMTMSM